jgi:HlyD family type I secretion membrane fusion protein
MVTAAHAKSKNQDIDHNLTRGAGINGRIVLGVFAILALIGGFGGWAATAELSGAVIGQGLVKVDKDLRAIQHLDGGILRSISVKKGDAVQEGQILFMLDDTALKAELAIARGQLVELTARRQRLIAERDGASDMPAISGVDPFGVANSEALSNETRLFKGNNEARASQMEQIRLSIVQVDDELGGLKSQQAANKRETQLVKTELTKFEGLKKKGLVEGSKVFSFARDLSKLNGEMEQIKSNTARALSHKSELQVQLDSIDKFARTEAQKQLADIEPRLAELHERVNAIAAKLERLSIRSPISGTVNDVSVNTIGGVITPAQKLLTIVPQDAILQIETHIQPTDIDQIYSGQEARVRFSAFSARETPELIGSISFVSPATTVDPATGRAYYVAQIEVAPDQLSKLNGKKLVPGMPVEVYAQTESRTVLSYLGKPMMDQFRRAFQEN